jgi:hypothetical protein
MFSKDSTVLPWFVTSFLFLGLVWTALFTVFNLWLSTGPPAAHPEMYRTRGEIFFGDDHDKRSRQSAEDPQQNFQPGC